MKYYAIKRKDDNSLITYSNSASEGDCCTSIRYSLSSKNYESVGEVIWFVPTKEQAINALNKPQDWWNSCYETPEHDLDPDDYEVVEITIDIQQSID